MVDSTDRTALAGVSAIIPARNAADVLATAVGSLQTQTTPPDEIVIAVGPSDDNTSLVAQSLADNDARVLVVDNPSGTIPAGLNRAIAASRGAVLVRLDAHAALPPDYVERVCVALEAPNVANAGGMQAAVGDTATGRAIAAALMSRFGAGGAAFHTATGGARAVDTVYLGAFDRAAVDAIGGYDEELLANEDYDLNWRLRDAGHEIWLDPALRVLYQPRDSLRTLARQFWRYGWWKQRMLKRHPASVRPRQLAAPALVVGLVGSALAAGPMPRIAAITPAVYGIAVAAAAATNQHEISLAERARLVGVYPTMHLAWGSGFLASLGQRLVRRG